MNELTDQDLCAICLSSINAGDYTLECSHRFHTDCIVEWFRLSQGNCPLCNHNPITNADNEYYGHYGISVINQRCSLIRQKFTRRKSCPPGLKKALLKLRELETKKNEFTKEKKEFLKLAETIKYKKLMAHYSYRGTWKHEDAICKQKIKIITMMPGYAII